MRGKSILSAYKKRMTGREVGVCKEIQKQGMTERKERL